MSKIKLFFSADNVSYEKLAIVLLVFFSLSIVILSQFHEMGSYNVETDFYGSYAPNALNMLNGGKYFDEDHGPGYVFVLIIFYLILGDIFVAGKTLTLISAVLFSYFSFKTILYLFNSKLAFFTLLLIIIFILPVSIIVSTDMFFAFLVSLAIYLLFRKGNFSTSNLIWGGVVAGYAIMTRLNAIILPFAVITAIIFLNPQSWNWQKRVKAILIFCFFILITASPWFVMNYIYYGKLFISEAHQTIGASFLDNQAPATAEPTDFAWGAQKEKVAERYNSLFALILHNFKSFLKFFLKNIINHFKLLLVIVIKFPAYLFLVPGAALLFSRVNRTQLSYFIIPVFGFLIYCIVAFIPRFYLYILPFFLLMISYYFFGTTYSQRENSEQKKYYWIKMALFIFMSLFLLKTSLVDLKKNITDEPLYLKKIAQTLTQHSNPSDKIFIRKPHLAFFSGLTAEFMPEVNNIDDLLTEAQQKNVKYVYYGVIETELRPGLKILQQPEQLPQNFQLIYSQNDPPVFLYKINF